MGKVDRKALPNKAIDSAPIKANASMNSLELKVPKERLDEHLRQVQHISSMDKETPLQRAKENKATKAQNTILLLIFEPITPKKKTINIYKTSPIDLKTPKHRLQ